MNSPLITVEMQGWKMDSMLSLGMTAVFFLPVFLPFKGVGQLTPYLDPFITIVLSMIMLPIPVKTVFTGIRDLLLISPEEDRSYRKVIVWIFIMTLSEREENYGSARILN